MIHTHNSLRLGDNLVQLNFLRRLCLQNPDLEITHYHNPELCKFEEIDALRSDISLRLRIRPISEAPADSIDSIYGIRLREAANMGVEILAYRAHISLQEVTLGSAIPVLLTQESLGVKSGN